MSFGTKLDAFRVNYGINKKLLAVRIGISYRHFKRILKDECSPPKSSTIDRIIEVLRLTPEEADALRQEAKQRVLP